MNLRVSFLVSHDYMFFNAIGRPFTRELIITEIISEENSYATIDGEGRGLPEVKQLTGLKLRYLPPGASMPKLTGKTDKTDKTSKKGDVEKTPKKEKKEKTEKTEKTPKKTKKEKTPKKK